MYGAGCMRHLCYLYAVPSSTNSGQLAGGCIDQHTGLCARSFDMLSFSTANQPNNNEYGIETEARSSGFSMVCRRRRSDGNDRKCW